MIWATLGLLANAAVAAPNSDWERVDSVRAAGFEPAAFAGFRHPGLLD